MIIAPIVMVAIVAAIGPDLSVTHPSTGKLKIIWKMLVAENM